MKKILSVILCFALLSCLLGISINAQSEDLKLTVAADTHLACIEDIGTFDSTQKPTYAKGMLDNSLYFHASLQSQMDYESTAIIKSMLRDFVKSDSEYLLIAGDLTGGKRASHLKMAELLKEAERESGREIFVTVGNHDCAAQSSEKAIDINEFMSIYADFGFNQALNRHSDSSSYTADLNSRYRLIAIDSCVYGKDQGNISDSVLQWVEEQAEVAKKDGVNLVGMMHHSILNHYAVHDMIKNADSIAQEFADLGIKFMFTGHLHANDISCAESDKGNAIYDIQTDSLITSPNAYREVNFTGNKVDIDCKYVTEIDTADLPNCYTPEQLEKIRTDFPGYSYSFFEAGICRWLNRNVGSAGKLAKKLKIEEGSILFKALDFLLQKVGDGLAMPIYNDGQTPETVDSIEEIALMAGVQLPESDFQRCYQVAAKIMGAFFYGDEDVFLNPDDVDLLFSCLKAVLAYSITEIVWGNPVSDIYSKGVEALVGINPADQTFSSLVKTNYSSSFVNKVIEALFDCLTDGLTTDLSAPSDISLALEGYNSTATVQDALPLNMFKKIFSYIIKFVMSLVA